MKQSSMLVMAGYVNGLRKNKTKSVKYSNSIQGKEHRNFVLLLSIGLYS